MRQGRVLPSALARAAGHARQYATLPFRLVSDDTIEILLVTSRETQRWVIPKGWPIATLSAPASAAREAFEEAGLLGLVLGSAPIGTYRYDKKRRDGMVSAVDVDVFLFQVTRQAKKWPEKAELHLRWCTPVEAAGLVQEVALAAMLRRAPELVLQAEPAPASTRSKAV